MTVWSKPPSAPVITPEAAPACLRLPSARLREAGRSDLPSALRPIAFRATGRMTSGGGSDGFAQAGGPVKTRPIPVTVAKCQSANHRKNRIAIYCFDRMRILVGHAAGRPRLRRTDGDGGAGYGDKAAPDAPMSAVENEDEAQFLMRFASGATGTIETSRIAAGRPRPCRRRLCWGRQWRRIGDRREITRPELDIPPSQHSPMRT